MTDSGNDNNPSSQSFISSQETPSSAGTSSQESLQCGKIPYAFADSDTTAGHDPVRPDNVAHHSSELNPYMASSHSLSAPPSAMNMAGMGSAFPAYQSSVIPLDQYHHMQPQFAVQSPGVYYQMHPAPSFRGGEQATDGRPPAYSMPYPVIYPHYLPQPQPSYSGFPTYVHSSPPHPAVNAPMFSQTPGYGSGCYPSPSPYPMVLGHGPGPPLWPQLPLRSWSQQSNPRRPTSSGPGPVVRSERPRRPVPKRAAVFDYPRTIVDGSNSTKSTRSNSRVSDTTSPSSSTSTPPQTITPGGPRRTPRQSGPALWVGNLPHGIRIVDVKEYFSQGVSDEIESVFLISRSHCAFINYKTEAACSAAQEKFHDSRFQDCRLVCRLRPNARPAGSRENSGEISTIAVLKGENDGTQATVAGTDSVIPSSDEKVPNRYFIVKSMTVEDLENSRQSGIWATQTHNEGSLNRAYESADNVYLIFSANKSGEYYGYARMVSPIQEDEKLALEMPQRSNQMATEAEEPSVTLTQASSTARSGRIIDDPVRGTIFWEADTSSEDGEKEKGEATLAAEITGAAPDGVTGADAEADTGANAACDKNVNEPAAVTEDGVLTNPTTTTPTTTPTTTTTTASQAIGRPFRIQWLSTVKVPFYRTRGLRNPWNANRGVKIARDGTQIEPRVGAQLVELFHLPSSGATGSSYRLPN